MSGRYKELQYWDSRYEEEERGHEWFGSYHDFAHLVRRELRPGTRGLVLGCGTSSLSAELHKEGVRPLVSIDYSPVCIKEMAQRNACVPDMSWMVMDARHLQFPDETFDLVIEKGTLDAMMVDEKDPWRVSQDTITLVDQVLSEVSLWVYNYYYESTNNLQIVNNITIENGISKQILSEPDEHNTK
ncbi:hypothetical protein GDO81_007787 [Engystomops pustulosus]|uniref:Methyltransferase domain-containing protein n=1 Tax=Engystomops pustulosus TaxID=76066 RepID=A0AAV7CBS4_ENGPU|nr:hypothetical protein GDO81_007787 [Engystomops pustulosus]